MKKYFLRLSLRYYRLLEGVIGWQRREIQQLRQKIEFIQIVSRGQDRQIKGYKKLTNSLTQDIVAQKKFIQYLQNKLEEHGDGTMKKRITNDFRKFLSDEYGLVLKDNVLYYVDEENDITCIIQKLNK